jgi:U-box domain
MGTSAAAAAAAVTGGAGESLVARLHAADVAAPEHFICPLSRELMRDPVMLTGDGQHYERAPCARWLIKNRTSPVTGEVLPACSFMLPARALKSEIWEFLDAHAEALSAAAAAAGASTAAAGAAASGSAADH